jgi:hypothetical protein
LGETGKKAKPAVAGEKRAYEQKKELREVNARMVVLREAIKASSKEIRDLRASVAGAAEERKVLEARRIQLRSDLDLTPGPDAGAT